MKPKRVANPPNPFTSIHAEWLEEPPAAELEVYEEQARSILTENDSPDVGFRWGVNAYRGCQHACAYCYARPYHEYLGLGAGTDFENKISVKTNAAELLDRELSRPKWQGDAIGFSGITDCYQPLEAVYELTRQCLEVCCKHRNPAFVITKSYLVARDAELLARLSEVASCTVNLSITFADDRRSKLIEPGAAPPSRRFLAMKKLHEAGVRVGVGIAPVIPGVNDREIPEILERAAEAGAQSAFMLPLRLPGSVQAVFLERLRANLPDAAARVEALIRGLRGGKLNDSRFGHRMRGEGPYWESVRQLFKVHATKFGLLGRTGGCKKEAKPAARVQLPLFQ